MKLFLWFIIQMIKVIKKYMKNFVPKAMSFVDDDDFLFKYAKINGLENGFNV